MPVRPNRTTAATCHGSLCFTRATIPLWPKPDHLKAAHERDFAVARDVLKSTDFLASCRARGVEPTKRQARKYLRGDFRAPVPFPGR